MDCLCEKSFCSEIISKIEQHDDGRWTRFFSFCSHEEEYIAGLRLIESVMLAWALSGEWIVCAFLYSSPLSATTPQACGIASFLVGTYYSIPLAGSSYVLGPHRLNRYIRPISF